MTDRSRGRERRRKRKRSEDFDDEGISGWKLGLVIGVVVVCFAMLYPTVFHPMIMGFFGAKEVQKSNANKPPIHPGMGPGGPRTGGPRHDHPAMRMAAAQHDAQQSTGGGRGMFTWMLPIYTVGVVIFLLYTLFKSKKKKKRRSYGSDSEESDSYDECAGQFSGKLGKKKLRGLQERLQQTEEAMTKILEQLEAVQGLDLTSIDQTSEQPTPKKEEKKKEPVSVKPALSSQSEQYIGDLEKALKEFKVLSEAYEKEKDRHLAEEDDSMTSDSELNSSASSADSEEEERVRHKERNRRRKEKEKKTKAKVISKEAIPKEEEVLEEESDERSYTKRGRSARRRAISYLMPTFAATLNSLASSSSPGLSNTESSTTTFTTSTASTSATNSTTNNNNNSITGSVANNSRPTSPLLCSTLWPLLAQSEGPQTFFVENASEISQPPSQPPLKRKRGRPVLFQ